MTEKQLVDIYEHIFTLNLSTYDDQVYLKKNVNSFCDDYRVPLLSLSVYHNMIDNVRYLLQNGADPNIANTTCETPLYYAIYSIRNTLYDIETIHTIIQLLLEYGADPYRKSINGESVFEITLRHGMLDVIQKFVEYTGYIPDEFKSTEYMAKYPLVPIDYFSKI